MLECLQQVPVEKLFTSSMYVGYRLDVPLEDRERSQWWPTIDKYSSDPVLPIDPLMALKSGSFNKVPFMSGTVKNEGAPMVMGMLAPGRDGHKNWPLIGAQ